MTKRDQYKLIIYSKDIKNIIRTIYDTQHDEFVEFMRQTDDTVYRFFITGNNFPKLKDGIVFTVTKRMVSVDNNLSLIGVNIDPSNSLLLYYSKLMNVPYRTMRIAMAIAFNSVFKLNYLNVIIYDPFSCLSIPKHITYEIIVKKGYLPLRMQPKFNYLLSNLL